MDDRLIRLIASCVMGFPGKDLPEILSLELLMYLMCRYQQSILQETKAAMGIHWLFHHPKTHFVL